LPLEGTGLVSKVGAVFDLIGQLVANQQVASSISSKTEWNFMRNPVAEWWRLG
jgi:hypothetical protein